MSDNISETSPLTHEEDPLDREYLQKNYHALGCSDVLIDVYKIYLESAPLKLKQIAPLLQEGKLESIISLAHGLKGESGSVGGRFIMAIAAAMEKAARTGNLEEARRLMPELEKQLNNIIKVIQQELDA